MADLTARPDHWTDSLPGNWQQAINTNPILNALGRALSRQSPDLTRGIEHDQYGSVSDRNWLLEAARGGPPKLNPLAAEMLDKGGLLANFLGPGVKLPAAAPKPTGIRAYHGSPHDFDRFDINKIGTGEGAQAYGRGLYFAESEGVAKSYKDKLGGLRSGFKINGNTYDPIGGRSEAAKLAMAERIDPAVAREVLAYHDKTPDEMIADVRRFPGGERDASILAAAEWKRQNDVKTGGRMYEVRINADPEQFLDWDKPLAQQPEARAILDRIRVNTEPEAPHDNPAVNNIRAALGQANVRRDDWQDAIKRPETVQALREAGIPGIKYLDQGSRLAGEGSRNYVVFDDKLIEILRKYGLLPPVAAGTAAAINQQEPPL